MLNSKAALPGHDYIRDNLLFHHHFPKQVSQNNGSTFHIDIRIWAFKTSCIGKFNKKIIKDPFLSRNIEVYFFKVLDIFIRLCDIKLATIYK
jgi:hypothetical protein